MSYREGLLSFCMEINHQNPTIGCLILETFVNLRVDCIREAKHAKYV
jgi:hypothetical protein